MILLSGCLIVGLVGCGNTKEKNAESLPSLGNMQQNETEFTLLELPDQVEFTSHILNYSTSLTECEVCEIEEVKFDEQKVQQLLAPESDLADWAIEDIPEYDLKIYSFSNGVKSINVGMDLFYTTENWSWKSTFGPLSSGSGEGRHYEWNGATGDLPFCSIEDAVGLVRTVLQSLGYEDIQVLNTYSIDHATMQTMEEYSLTDKTYQNEMEQGKRPPKKEVWTNADDGYLFDMRIIVNGLPVLCSTYILPDDSMVTGGEIFAGYGTTGIEYLELGEIFQITGKSAEKLLSYQQILEVLVEKYNNLIVESPTVISDVQLAYYPIIENNQQKLIPVWAFTEKVGSSSRYIYINAINGKEI